MLNWVKPAIEYAPQWMHKVNDIVLPSFARSATGSSAGFTTWINLHRSWVGLFLKSAISYAFEMSAWDSAERLIGNSQGAPPGEPLALSPDFTWAMGDSEVGFRDFLNFVSLDGNFEGSLEIRTETGTRMACGTDMALGLARCLYQERIGRGSDPLNAYAAFASHHCPNIRWLARAFDRSDSAARSIGATDVEQLRDVANRRWEDLVALHHPQSFQHTCSSWESAIDASDHLY